MYLYILSILISNASFGDRMICSNHFLWHAVEEQSACFSRNARLFAVFATREIVLVAFATAPFEGSAGSFVRVVVVSDHFGSTGSLVRLQIASVAFHLARLPGSKIVRISATPSENEVDTLFFERVIVVS